MKLQVPDNLKSISLINTIKLLFDDYMTNYQDDINDNESFNNLQDRIKELRRTSINDYLNNLIKFIMFRPNTPLTSDDISYGLALVESVKGSPSIMDFIGLMPNIDILSWEYGSTPVDGATLTIVIDRLESTQVNFVVDQLRKSLFSLLLIAKLSIHINTIVSLVNLEGETVVASPVVQLNSNYEFTFTELQNLLNGTE